MGFRILRQALLVFCFFGSSFVTHAKFNPKAKVHSSFRTLIPYEDADYRKQLYSFVDLVYLGNNEADERVFVQGQVAGENFLYLGPNEVFFTTPGKLRVGGAVKNPDMDLNQGKEFSFISALVNVDEIMEWSLLTTNSGDIQGETFLQFEPKDVGSILTLILDDKDSVDIELTEGMLKRNLELVPFSFSFLGVEPGVHTLKIKLKKLTSTTIKIYNNRLQGSAISGSHVLRERWRPYAAYVRWHSTKNTGSTKAWVFEISSSSELGHFSPMSTSFGYYGPVFNPGGKVSGVNFSVWSYSAGQPMPPIYQLSHLLGIGSEKGVFSGYGHEGTGVKVRDWNIFENNNTGTYVIGLRYVNDGIYTTFYGYFWNIATKKWQLFTIGRKYRKNPLQGLSKFSFIEVPGAAEQQRTNHLRRVVQYRGWVRDENGVWSEIDRMESVVGNRFITNVDWDVRSDRRFEVSGGGLKSRIRTEVPQFKLKENSAKLPPYMGSRKLKQFFKVPFIPVISSMAYRADTSMLRLVAKTKNKVESKVTFCWGETDALTLEKFWDHCQEFTKAGGVTDLAVEVPATVNDRFARVLVRNGKAQMWSFNTKELSALK